MDTNVRGMVANEAAGVENPAQNPVDRRYGGGDDRLVE